MCLSLRHNKISHEIDVYNVHIFRLKQRSDVVFPASVLRLVPRAYPTLNIKYKALPHVPPHFSPVSPPPPTSPVPSWALLHLGLPPLVLFSLGMRSINQFFVQKTMIEN